MKVRIGFAIICAAAQFMYVEESWAELLTWTWDRPADEFIADHTVAPNTYNIPSGQVNESAGIIESVMATFDTDTNQLGWSVTFGGQPDGSTFHTTNGFWLVVSPGTVPTAAGGETAHIFFDASSDDPILTAYAYNGQGAGDSYLDGTGDGDPPDPILSSILNPGAVLDLSVTGDPATSLTMSFLIDASSIQSHVPMYPSDNPWTGVSFADMIGVWMHPFTNVNSSYSNGFLSDWSFARHGWFDAESQIVPGPGALAALAALVLIRSPRRRH